jgi:hypothetical protein
MPEWETIRVNNTVRLRRRPVRYHASTPATSAAETIAETTPDYSDLKKDELIVEAEKQGLDSSGTKAEIIERLSHE